MSFEELSRRQVVSFLEMFPSRSGVANIELTRIFLKGKITKKQLDYVRSKWNTATEEDVRRMFND